MSGSGPVRDDPNGPERMEELFGNAFDLASKIAPRVGPDEVDARLRRTLQEASHHPEGTLAGQAGRRFRVGEVPPLAEGYTERPDTARGIIDTLVPGSTLALVPDTASAEGSLNWRGACGKTQTAVIIAESLWRSGAIDALIWISATNRAAVLSRYVQASAAATGIEPTGTAESVAARFISWLGMTSQPWLIVLDDVLEPADLDGLWPEGPTGRVLITCTQSSAASARPGTHVVPIGSFSVREALNCLTERLSINPAQHHGAVDLIEALGREPLAVAQVSSVLANSHLSYRDYRDYFARRRQQIGMAAGEVPSAAAVTWTLSLGQAELLLPGASVRLMLVLLALLDGHGIPGSVFSAPSVAAYLGGAVLPSSSAVDPKPACEALLAMERAGLINLDRAVTPPTILMSSVLQAAIRLAAPANVQDPAARAAASALLEAWPADEPEPWTAASLRANAASLQACAADVLWAEGCHPLLLRAGRSLDAARLVGSAVEYWQDLAVRCETELAPCHPDALVVAAQLAAAYLAAAYLAAAYLAAAYLAANYAAEAVRWYQSVLAMRGRDLAAGHPAIVAARVSLAKALPTSPRARGCGDRAASGRRRMRAVPRSWPPGHPRCKGRASRRVPSRRGSGDGHPDPHPHSGRSRTPAGTAQRGHHHDPGPPRSGLPGRRQDQGRHLALQAGPVRPREDPGAWPSGHDRHLREPCRCLRGGRPDGDRVAALRADLRRI